MGSDEAARTEALVVEGSYGWPSGVEVRRDFRLSRYRARLTSKQPITNAASIATMQRPNIVIIAKPSNLISNEGLADGRTVIPAQNRPPRSAYKI
jgi:hypothetical protein